MGFRFYRRVSILPGVSLNLGKRGASVSVGPRGAKMTFGSRGVKSSVGIPGTGIRYETPYSGSRKTSFGDGGNVSPWFVIAVICGIVAFLMFKLSEVDRRNPAFPLVMVLAGLGAVVFFLLAVVGSSSGGSSEIAATTRYAGAYAKPSVRRKLGRWDSYMRELANASQALYDFMRELNRSTRCRNLLKALPGMEAVTGNSFTINQRLAVIVYCDLLSCFRKLGHDETHLDNLEGMGYAMFMCLMITKDFELSRFFDPQQCHKLANVISEMSRTAKCSMDIEGHEGEYRFAFLFGTVNHETEWVQRFSSLLYRWASLVAKADGVVSDAESKTLAAIMEMKETKTSGGNVKVTSPDAGGNASIGRGARTAKNSSSQPNPNRVALKEVVASLDSLVGLSPVKAEVKKMVSFIEIQRRRVASGLKAAPVGYHCVFTGNPGTGKTTVARILADVYRELGVVKKGHLVETDRSGLVGEYVGQTAVKTNKVIDAALDGVLFIDEAYTLVQGGEKDYGPEAIATLLKRMEDDRDRLVVVLAGYTSEMKSFVNSNPGLQSRFNRYIDFPDYSAEELARIFLLQAEKSQYVCDSDVRNSIVQIMEAAVQQKDKNFGNGRFVRNLFETAIQRQAVRLSTVAPLTTEMLSELTLHDLGFAYED